MKEQSSRQTAYQHNAHSCFMNPGGKDYGWADTINRMINQRYAFLGLEFENTGYLFRGMGSGLIRALLDDQFWHYADNGSASLLEQELGVLFFSQDFSDAYTVSHMWENNKDSCILIFRSEIFNLALKEKKAAMMATAEPDIVFKYPFLAYPLTLDDIDYVICSTNLIGAINNRNEFKTFNDLDDISFAKLSSLITNLQNTRKLLIPALSKEGINRSSLEDLLMDDLIKRQVTGAKAIISKFKPARVS